MILCDTNIIIEVLKGKQKTIELVEKIGINIKEYNFNYAYSSFGEIGALHRIGVKTEF